MSPRIVHAGDSAIIVEFEERIDPVVNAAAIALAASLRAAVDAVDAGGVGDVGDVGDVGLRGIRDIVPTYRSVAVYFDPLRVDYDALLTHLERASGARAQAGTETAVTIVRIPVCYGGEFGPDLPDVAAFACAGVDDVIGLHTAPTYRVFMLGFVAGFAYLGTVNERIAMPRHSTPRVRVPPGSVGIAGGQTGVYPMETPGGWRLVGRTPARPFDLSRSEPFLMKAGDAVQFYAISRTEYDAWPSS